MYESSLKDRNLHEQQQSLRFVWGPGWSQLSWTTKSQPQNKCAQTHKDTFPNTAVPSKTPADLQKKDVLLSIKLCSNELAPNPLRINPAMKPNILILLLLIYFKM